MSDQNVNRKERISERYKGVDPSVLEVIPAKPINEINIADRTLKVAAYVRVSTEKMNRNRHMSFRSMILPTG